jgi:hypothetical protein
MFHQLTCSSTPQALSSGRGSALLPQQQPCYHRPLLLVGHCRFQKTISLPNHKRGCHVVTRKILAELPELGEYEVGLANLFSECRSYRAAATAGKATKVCQAAAAAAGAN